MAGVAATIRITTDNGVGAVSWEILWSEMCLLGYASENEMNAVLVLFEVLTRETGWAKFMEWKYPVIVEVTSPAAFKGAGAVQAAASL